MKQAEEAKRNAQSSARSLLDEYRPLKHDVDLMRTELLGLEKLPDLPQSDKERMGSIGYVFRENFMIGLSSFACRFILFDEHQFHEFYFFIAY